jgi:hypothetical protein
VKAGPLIVALAGISALREGIGFVTVKAKALELPPPGAGFTTVTTTVPA